MTELEFIVTLKNIEVLYKHINKIDGHEIRPFTLVNIFQDEDENIIVLKSHSDGLRKYIYEAHPAKYIIEHINKQDNEFHTHSFRFSFVNNRRL